MSPGVNVNNFKVEGIYLFYKYHELLLNVVMSSEFYHMTFYSVINIILSVIFGYFKRLDTITKAFRGPLYP